MHRKSLDKTWTATHKRRTSLLALGVLIATGFLLAGCQAPITYAKGRSSSDLPPERTTVLLGSVDESNMLGTQTISNSADDQIRLNRAAQDEILSTLKSSGFSVAERLESCPACISLRGRLYYLPYNPAIGGHVNMFINAYDPAGHEIFTAFNGRDFGLINLVVEGSDEQIVRKSARFTTQSLIQELKK